MHCGVQPAAPGVQQRAHYVDVPWDVAIQGGLSREHREAADALDLERAELLQEPRERDGDAQAGVGARTDVDDQALQRRRADAARSAQLLAEPREVSALSGRHARDRGLAVYVQRRRERGVAAQVAARDRERRAHAPSSARITSASSSQSRSHSAPSRASIITLHFGSVPE